jgi:transcriptional regulator with XRE-family HTH domain
MAEQKTKRKVASRHDREKAHKERIGRIIKDLRNKQGITQVELAEGICTQGIISAFESGVKSPKAIILYHLAKRLNVDPNYFFEISYSPYFDHVHHLKAEMNYLRKSARFDELYSLVTREKEGMYFTQDAHKQFLKWNEIIARVQLRHLTYEYAIKEMNEILDITNPGRKGLNEFELEIYQSIASFYGALNETDKYKKMLFEIEEFVQDMPFFQNQDLILKVYYNLANVYLNEGDYKTAIEYTDKGLDYGKLTQNAYTLGHNLFVQGLAKYHSNVEGYKPLLKKALETFEFYNDAQALYEAQVKVKELNIEL